MRFNCVIKVMIKCRNKGLSNINELKHLAYI